jgi:hypothetical protein
MRTHFNGFKRGITVGVTALLCLVAAPAGAQNLYSSPPPTPLTKPNVPLAQQKQQYLDGVSAAPASEAYSVVRHLALGLSHIERLDRLYDAFAAVRRKEEVRIAGWQEDLKRAQSPATLDERKANDLVRNITGAQQKIASAFLQARAAALKGLSPVERAQLESLSRTPEQLRDDSYRQLLLLPLESVLQAPLQPSLNHPVPGQLSADRERDKRQRSGYGSYGV